MSLFSKLEVSEFDEDLEDEEKIVNDDKDKIMEEELKCDEDIAFETRKLCNKCRMAENGNNEDTSEVSLIAVDNEDQQENVDENDGESVDENNATQEMIDSEKSSKLINILINQLQICI